MRCENCSTILRNGVCTYCEEEYYISNYQTEFIDRPLSDEFLTKVGPQEAAVIERSKRSPERTEK